MSQPIELLTHIWPDGGLSLGEEHPAVTAGRQMLEVAMDCEEPESLAGWRTIIDDLDFSLMATIAARVQATEHVGRLKAAVGGQAVDLARERVVVNRATTAAGEIGMERSVVAGMMTALINKAHRQHAAARQANTE